MIVFSFIMSEDTNRAALNSPFQNINQVKQETSGFEHFILSLNLEMPKISVKHTDWQFIDKDNTRWNWIIKCQKEKINPTQLSYVH